MRISRRDFLKKGSLLLAALGASSALFGISGRKAWAKMKALSLREAMFYEKLDGGKTKLGRESTVVDTTVFPYKILRKGAVSEEEIACAWKKTTWEK